jgi:RND superfamily putative drug exporter
VDSWTERAARAASRHAKRTLAVWGVVFLVAVALIATLLPSALTTDSHVLNDPESERAYDLIASRLPLPPDRVDELVAVYSPTLTLDDPRFRVKLRRVRDALEATGAVRQVQDPLGPAADPQLVSRDRHAALLAVELGPNAEEQIERVVEAVRAEDGNGFEVAVTGEWSADHDFMKLSNDDLKNGELFFGLPASLVVLVLVFGAVVGAMVPLILAIVSIVVALGLTALLGQGFELSYYVVNMLTGMGLALGIDYALFVVSRFREERVAGRSPDDAIGVAGRTATRAVFFSGAAFVLAMFGMVIVPDTILRSLAAGAILVGFVSVAAALTLLPALLALLGDRVNALRLPLTGRLSPGAEGRFWSAIVRAVMRRPVVSVVAAVVLLLAAAAPVLDIRTGLAGIRTLPDAYASKQGFLLLEREFGVGTTDTVQVVVEGDVRDPQVRLGVQRVEALVERSPVFGAPEVTISPRKDLALIEALVAGDSRDTRTEQAVEQLRRDARRALAGTGARVLVTGETAEVIDYRNLTSQWLPRVFAFVLGLSFLLLTLAFRSIVVAAKAIVLNLLSVGAAYGLLVLVFQHGVGNELFGFSQVDAIAAWLPLFLFSVLFGLSMDYHVFLLSRIRERYLQSGDNAEAVASGIGTTARLITGAALIIIAVFAGFASGQLVEFQQMGFGVAVSLFIDATLIRCVLLPAAMKLLGDWNWYLPGWLGWLPHVEIEAAEAPPG